jgi:hypothetical protein
VGCCNRAGLCGLITLLSASCEFRRLSSNVKTESKIYTCCLVFLDRESAEKASPIAAAIYSRLIEIEYSPPWVCTACERGILDRFASLLFTRARNHLSRIGCRAQWRQKATSRSRGLARRRGGLFASRPTNVLDCF